MIPYVGRMLVAGKTPSQAAALIQDGLSSQTVRPQVVVSLVGNTANTVSVGGEVNKAGLMPLSLRGEKLLDVVAWEGPQVPRRPGRSPAHARSAGRIGPLATGDGQPGR